MSFWFNSEDTSGAVQMANEVHMPLLVFTADDSELSQKFGQVLNSGKADQVISGNYIAVKVIRGTPDFDSLNKLLSLKDNSNISIFVEGSIRALIDTCDPNTNELMEDLSTALITIKRLDDGESVDSIRDSLDPNANTTLNLKPLTEEEKAKKKEDLKNLLDKRRAERLIKEKEEAKEREAARREMGKSLATAKVQQQEKEMKQILDKKLKEKQEDRLAKQRVREQIALDKAERAARKQNVASQPIQTPAPVVSSSVKSPTEAPTTCKLAIRLLDGSVQRLEFTPSHLLRDVREPLKNVSPNLEGNFRFQLSYPSKLYSDDDETKSLLDLGLCPTNSLIIKKAL